MTPELLSVLEKVRHGRPLSIREYFTAGDFYLEAGDHYAGIPRFEWVAAWVDDRITTARSLVADARPFLPPANPTPPDIL